MGSKGQALIGYTILFVFLGVTGLALGLSSFYTVGSGERAVVVSQTQGTIQQSFGEGFHWKTPFIDDAIIIDIKTHKYEVAASAASKDLQTVTANIAVNYHVEGNSAHTLYQTIGMDYENRVIVPYVQEVVKGVTAKYNADELITKRPEVSEQIKIGLRERMLTSHLILDEVSITNFDFSAQFNAQIEAKVTSVQRALTEENNLRVIEFTAKQKVAEAEGEAEATRVKAIAEAESIRIRAEALKESPELIQLELAKRWDGKLPQISSGNSGMILQLPMPQGN